MKALGIIETRGLVTAIEALDTALKTADIEVVNRHIVKGGIVTVEICGDVGAVKVATEAGAAAAKRLGNFISSHVIARPDDMVYEMIETEKALEKDEEKTEETIPKEIEIKEEIKSKEEIVIDKIEKKMENSIKEEKNKKK